MLITRESDYAIRIVRALRDSELMTLGQICDKEKVPRQFAYKILKKLELAGIVGIKRGSCGGCYLNKKRSQITLYDIISATDTDFFLSHCMRSGYQCEYMNHTGSCTVHMELARVQEIMEQELKRYTMEELV